MTLDHFNRLPEPEAEAALRQCCVSTRWIEQLCAARPFASLAELQQQASTIWSTLAMPDYLEAFEGHPRIGDLNSLKAKYANTKQLAAGEQAGAGQASDAVLAALAEGNRAYEARFGFIFIVCASGKSADEMLALLQARLHNPLQQELQIAAAEQDKITRVRLQKMLSSEEERP